jgi:hypothetical protein
MTTLLLAQLKSGVLFCLFQMIIFMQVTKAVPLLPVASYRRLFMLDECRVQQWLPHAIVLLNWASSDKVLFYLV